MLMFTESGRAELSSFLGWQYLDGGKGKLLHVNDLFQLNRPR